MGKKNKDLLIIDGILLAIVILSALFHNILSGMLKTDEPLFFSLCLLSTLLFALTSIFIALAIMLGTFKKIVLTKKKTKLSRRH